MERKFTVVEWNIRGAASLPWNNNYEIKKWVVDEILKDSPMCVVLTEFVVSKGWDYLQSELERKEYIWFVTSTTAGNGILIAISKKSGFDYSDICNYNPSGYVFNNEILLGTDVPDFYEIRVKNNGTLFSIIGVRIRNDVYGTNTNYKQKQFTVLDSYLCSLKHHVICIGDFNAYWPGIWKSNNNHTLPKTSRSYTLHTPPYNAIDGFSYVKSDGSKLQLDHLITNIEFNRVDVSYEWDFVNSMNGYAHLSKSDYKNIIGIPDHAILKVNMFM